MKKLFKTFLALFIVLVSVGTVNRVYADEPSSSIIQRVEGGIEDKFTDENLLKYVRDSLELSSTEPVTEANIKELILFNIHKVMS